MIGSSSAGYVVAAADYSVGSPFVTVWEVTGPADDPTMTVLGDVAVSDYYVPAPVAQPGTPKTLDTSDVRLTQAVAGPDASASGATAIWTQHTIDNGSGRSVVRWYEIVPSSGTPLRQEGEISVPGAWAFNGAISPAANGTDAVINYTVGSSSLYVQARAQSRTDATTLGTMTGEVLVRASPTSYGDGSCQPGCRWGDYAAASPDPVDTDVVWGSTQLAGSFASSVNWVTRNFALSARANAQPDGRIKKGSGRNVGNDIYNADAAGQTKTASKSPGTWTTFKISIQNDGGVTDKFSVAPSGSSVTGYVIRYFVGTADVTTAVTSGSFQTAPLGPGAIYVLKAKVKTKSSAAKGSSINRLITITSAADSDRIDAVQFVVSRK